MGQRFQRARRLAVCTRGLGAPGKKRGFCPRTAGPSTLRVAYGRLSRTDGPQLSRNTDALAYFFLAASSGTIAAHQGLYFMRLALKSAVAFVDSVK